MAFENDLAFLRLALPEMQDYILSKDVYRPLSGAPRMPGSAQVPQLTIGNLLLSQARLSAQSAGGEQATELAQLKRGIAELRASWRSNWANKAAAEYASRLNLWSQYLRELRADPRAGASAYPSEVRHRAILRLLEGELLEGVPQPEVEQRNLVDGILKGLTQPGPFTWEPAVESAFPQDDFWFLYVVVRK